MDEICINTYEKQSLINEIVYLVRKHQNLLMILENIFNSVRLIILKP
jgi:hypothetical protein